MTPRSIRVELVFAGPQHVIIKTYQLNSGARLAELVKVAAQDAAFRGVDLSKAPLGIFGRPVEPHQVLRDGDRVEVYRPLIRDPKSARRERAKSASKSGRS